MVFPVGPDSRSRRSRTLSALAGFGKPHAWKVLVICSSRSLRSVTMTIVGFSWVGSRRSFSASHSIVRLLPEPWVCQTRQLASRPWAGMQSERNTARRRIERRRAAAIRRQINGAPIQSPSISLALGFVLHSVVTCGRPASRSRLGDSHFARPGPLAGVSTGGHMRPKHAARKSVRQRTAAVRRDAAGIDIGARRIHVAVNPERDARTMQEFQTSTQDLYALADWLEACGVERSRWSRPACSGSRSTRCSRRAGSRCASSTRAT